MPIYLSDALHLSPLATGDQKNAPLIFWQSAVIPAGFTADGDNPQAVWSPDTYTHWKSPVRSEVAAFDWQFNMEVFPAQAVNYIGIAGHNFYRNNSGSPFALSLAASYDNITFFSVVAAQSVTSAGAIVFHFDNVTARYWRVVITSQPGLLIFAKVAHIKLGAALRLQKKVFVGVTPFTLGKKVEKTATTSSSGKYLGGYVKSIINTYSINQIDNDGGHVRTEINRFLDHAELIEQAENKGPSGTFFAAWRPFEFPSEVLYCHSGQVTRPSNQRNNGAMQWGIAGEAEA